MQNNPYLSGNYAPVKDELEMRNLKIIGEIPKDLTGIYMRNDPNPAFTPISYTYPLDFVFHFANAYENDNEIIIDYVRHETGDFFVKDIDEREMFPMLYRTIININSGTIKHTQLDDRVVEFPRIKEDYDTLSHQFIYTTTRTTDMAASQGFNAIIKYDVKNKSSQIHEFGQHAQVGEPVFALGSTQQSEDGGYLMLFVYDAISEQSEFVILDAKNFGDLPLARIKMPRRVPSGFHGSWMPGEWVW